MNRGFKLFLSKLECRLLTLTLARTNKLKNSLQSDKFPEGTSLLSCPRGIIPYNLLIGSYSYPCYIIAMPVGYVYKLYSYTPFGLKMVERIYPQF